MNETQRKRSSVAIRAKKRDPMRSLPREAPLEWQGFSDAFWRQNITDAKFFVRPKLPRVDSAGSVNNGSNGNSNGGSQSTMSHLVGDDEMGRSAKERDNSNEALTDLQKLIVQAIVVHRGSASTDEIEQYVSQFWSKLKKRDGSSYAYDCRRVVLASLSNASNIRPLFLRDPEAPSEQRWKIGPRGDDLGIKLDELPFVDVSQKLGGAASARLRTARQKRVRSVSPSDAKRSRGDAAATAAAGAANSVVQSTLANLSPEQHAVASYLYHCADVAANIADIVIVLQRAGYVTSSGSRTEARRQAELILEVEPGFTPFVTRAANDKWALVNELVEELDDANADDESSESGDDDGAGDADDDSSTTPTAKRSRSRSPANTADTFADEVHVHHSTTTAAAPPPPPPQQQHQQQQSHHQQQQSHHTGSSAPPSGSSLSVIFGEGDVSAMQETLMGIVLEHGGSALLETISELAAQRIPSIRKKNMDVRRSIVASLSHNPPGFFRKHARKPGFWTITPRGRLLAEAMMNSSADRAKYSLDDAASGSD